MKHDIKFVRENARGRWSEILSFHGINRNFLKNSNGPCPFCGGKDRWRWDNKNNEGGGFCHQCDARGSGIAILGKWLDLSSRKDFSKLLEAIVVAVDILPASTIASPSTARKSIEYARSIWNGLAPLNIQNSNALSKYLIHRGLPMTGSCNIRFHPNLKYVYEGEVLGFLPCIVAQVLACNGDFLGIHRTYLTNEGRKGNVPVVKMALGPIRGGAIRLDDCDSDLLNIAEGIETAMAVREISKSQTWAAMSATNMEALEIPSNIKKVIIWADRDANKVGEKAAHSLARKLHHKGISAYINLPPWSFDKESVDWLDVFSEKKSVEVAHG